MKEGPESDFFAALAQAHPQSLLVFDLQGRGCWANPAFFRLPGVRGRRVPDWSDFLVFAEEEDRSFLQGAFERMVREGPEASHSVLFRWIHAGGEARLVEAQVRRGPTPEGSEGLVWYLSYVLDRRSAEDLLAAERERLLVTLRSIGDGVIATDVEGRVTLLNLVSEQLTEWPSWQAVGRPLPEVFTIVNEDTGEAVANPVDLVLQEGRVVELANHTVLISRSGRRYAVEDCAAPIRNRKGEIVGAVLVFRDVTLQKRDLEERLKVQKLESIGLLAGGIAHDFNNILTAILGNVSLAILQDPPEPTLREHLREIETATNRATQLTQQLLTFAKGGSPVLTTATLNDLITESARFVSHGASAEIRYDLARDLRPAVMDRGQIGQVIQNLVLNALQAMEGGGVLSLRSRNRRLEIGEAGALEPGDYVCIEVQDEGPGISRSHLERIFEPYFTTKETGHGLGLAVVYSIVRNHKGRIEVESEPGRGTLFRLYLPASAEAPPNSAEGRRPASPGRWSGLCLVMDDETSARRILIQMLEVLGFECVPARNGLEAIDLTQALKTQGRHLALCFLDLTVPGGLGGRETLPRLREIDPSLRAVVVSGYSTDAALSHFAEAGFQGCLAKPYPITVLRQVLLEILGPPE